MSFDLTFEGYGIVNGIKYKDNRTGIFLTNPADGSVYRKGIIGLRTNSDSIETTYESISRKHNNGIVRVPRSSQSILPDANILSSYYNQ